MKRSLLLSLLCCSVVACAAEEGSASTGWVPGSGTGGDDDDDDDDSSPSASDTAQDTDEPGTISASNGSSDSDTNGETGSDTESDTNSGTQGESGSETGTDTSSEVDVPEFGATLTVIGTAADGLSMPRDLEFSPTTGQLWTANKTFHGVVIFFSPGEAAQTSEVRADIAGAHFMSYVSSISFAPNNFFASCQESRNDWNGGPQAEDDFMGPTLWQADLNVFAQGSSHMDMLHQSPLCMGIAHDSANVYWAFDGKSGHIVRYDFRTDHGPGGDDHSDGAIRRYLNATVTRVPNVPSHMVLDQSTGSLYVADTGGGRIMMLDTASGSSTGPLSNNWDGVPDYSGMDGAAWTVIADGLAQPSGLALAGDGRFFVGDYSTGEIIAFHMSGTELGRMSTTATGLMGIEIGPDGKLWYADGPGNQIVRVDP